MLRMLARVSILVLGGLMLAPAAVDARPASWAAACRDVVQRRVGRPVTFISTRSDAVSRAVFRVTGTGRVRVPTERRRPAAWRSLNFRCNFDRRTGRLLSSAFNWVGGPVYFPGGGGWIPYSWPVAPHDLPEGPER
jgi:hypothetical protein